MDSMGAAGLMGYTVFCIHGDGGVTMRYFLLGVSVLIVLISGCASNSGLVGTRAEALLPADVKRMQKESWVWYWSATGLGTTSMVDERIRTGTPKRNGSVPRDEWGVVRHLLHNERHGGGSSWKDGAGVIKASFYWVNSWSEGVLVKFHGYMGAHSTEFVIWEDRKTGFLVARRVRNHGSDTLSSGATSETFIEVSPTSRGVLEFSRADGKERLVIGPISDAEVYLKLVDHRGASAPGLAARLAEGVTLVWDGGLGKFARDKYQSETERSQEIAEKKAASAEFWAGLAQHAGAFSEGWQEASAHADEMSERAFAWQQTMPEGDASISSGTSSTPSYSGSGGYEASSRTSATGNTSSAGAPRRTLRFRLYTGLELGSKSTINPRCFSNVITVANVAMERDDQLTAEVRSIIESRFDEFLGKCAAMADGVLRGKPALGGPYYEIGSRADNFPVDTRPENAFVNMR